MQKDIRTKAFVLRRTNYGEADRILTLLTENGEKSVIAKGVRKEKSKLAGGIELFCLSEVVIHEGKNNKLGILTSAKMLTFFQTIPVDIKKLELASMILTNTSRFAKDKESPEYFNLIHQSFTAINDNMNFELVEAWFWLNLAKINGEQLNLFRDTNNDVLDSQKKYVWNQNESSLSPQLGGNVGANEIKFMRLALTNDLAILSKIKNIEKILPSVLYIAKSLNKL